MYLNKYCMHCIYLQEGFHLNLRHNRRAQIHEWLASKLRVSKWIREWANLCLSVHILCLIESERVRACTNKGPSIKYVTLFLANFDPPSSLSHFVTHPGTPRKYVTHLGLPPRFLVGLVQKTRTKAPYTNSLSIVRGFFCPGVFCLEGFVHSPFCQNASVTTQS